MKPTHSLLKGLFKAPKLLLALAALAAPLGLTAPAAQAGGCRTQDRGDFVVRVGSHRGNSHWSAGYQRSHPRPRHSSSWSRSSRHQRHHQQDYDRGYKAPSGYYKRVYVPAVYRTHYDDCGRARRVCVRAAHYDRVWVPARRCRTSRW
ncbi:MAG: hypothetical protein V3V20_10615 [Algisphaera sp.]